LPDERVDRLTQHARVRAEQTLERAQQALAAMAADGDVLTVARLAHRARVSRSWIYTRPELRDRIEQLRHTTTASPTPAAATSRASVDSLRRRLELAHQRITQLRDENRQLRESLALLHGQRRGQ